MKVEILYIGNDIAKSIVVGGPYIKGDDDWMLVNGKTRRFIYKIWLTLP